MGTIWAAHGVFHMAMKRLIQKKLSFKEIGKNTDKPNGKIKSKCRKTEFLRLRDSNTGSSPVPENRDGVIGSALSVSLCLIFHLTLKNNRCRKKEFLRIQIEKASFKFFARF
jgi:hypothetical protein